jgi:protein-S-isoprenylcysteine O-methyltransferase Ste14
MPAAVKFRHRARLSNDRVQHFLPLLVFTGCSVRMPFDRKYRPMTTEVQKQPESSELEGTFLGIDGSSWVAWSSYYFGFVLAGSPKNNARVMQLGWEVAVLVGAIIAFFGSILLIQRHMKFSLLANTYGTPNHLVTDGVFAYSRNPIYVAFFMPLLSLAVLSPIAAGIALVVYILGMNRWVIAREERVLEDGFGDEYRAYKTRTRRWL